MFDNCSKCGGKMQKSIDTINGYWLNTQIEFKDIEVLYCDVCKLKAVKQDVAIFTQEITRAIHDMNLKVKKVEFINSYDLLLKEYENIYEWIISRKINPIITGDKLILNNKLPIENNGDYISFAARNYSGMTSDLEKLIKGN